MTARIGTREVEVRRQHLRLHEVAFLLRVTEREVRNRLRAGKLPITWVGRLRLVNSIALSEHLEHDPLALEFLARLIDGTFRMPRFGARPSSQDVQPPDLTTYLGAL